MNNTGGTRDSGSDSDDSSCSSSSASRRQEHCGVGTLGTRAPSLVVCTRIHLGKSSSPPNEEALEATVSSFFDLAASCGARRAAIAVDSEERIPGYDLPRALEDVRDRLRITGNDLGGVDHRSGSSPPARRRSSHGGDGGGMISLDIVRVSPWGNFVAALNALVSWASPLASLMLLVSAETSLTPGAVRELCSRFDFSHPGGCGVNSPLVVGAALPGHDYNGACEVVDAAPVSPEVAPTRVDLNGRTTPWNTAAVWNLEKLALTGFPLVAEGLHRNEDGSAVAPGVEEVSTIALLQNLLPRGQAEAVLVGVPGVAWEQSWPDDEERRRWHEQKMRSKVARPARHLELLGGLKGSVLHC